MLKLKLSELKKLEGNPRTIKKEDLDKLTKSIEKFGIIEGRPFLVSNRTGENIIIGGNQRYEVCKNLGITEVPVHIIEGLTEEEEKEIIIRDNISNGEWDWDILANEWDKEELEEWGLDVQFETVEPEAEEDDFEVDEGIQTDIVLGDLFEIGPHRLLCGDSTNIDDVNKLMNGEKADMVFTDPPYGIGLDKEGQTIGKSKKYGAVLNDGDNTVAIDVFNLVSGLGIEVLFFWGANHYSNILPPSPCWIVWDKQGGKHVTYADVELCYSNIDAPARMFSHIWDGFRKDSEKGEKRVHPTQKPVKLIEEIWKYFEIKADIVLDLFGGSGSTMVACHQLNRKCFMSELDPKYVQTIINRMIKLDSTLEIKRNGVPYTNSDFTDK